MDLNLLTVFLRVATTRSFSKAAEQLHQPKSSVSRHVASLEKELGVQLIHRTTRQFNLTPSGEELYRSLTPLLGDVHSSLERLKAHSEELSGPVKITVPEDIGVELMGSFCKDFLSIYPKVRIDLHVSNEKMDLVKESFDLALRIGRAEDSSMRQRKLGTIHLALVMGLALPLRYGPIQDIEQLEGLPYLAFSRVSQTSLLLRKGSREYKLKLKPVFVSNNFFVLRDMVMQGAGFCLLPSFLMKTPTESRQLQLLLPDWKTEGSPVQLLFPQPKEPPARVREFSEFLARSLARYV